MKFIALIGVFSLVLLFAILFIVFICRNTVSNESNKINPVNSTLAVQCKAPDTCILRHTTSCDTCKNNCGRKKDKNFYERV